MKVEHSKIRFPKSQSTFFASGSFVVDGIDFAPHESNCRISIEARLAIRLDAMTLGRIVVELYKQLLKAAFRTGFQVKVRAVRGHIQWTQSQPWPL